MNGSSFRFMVTASIVLALLVPAAAPFSAVPAPASPLATGEIKLVAQDLIDLGWEPGKYPYPEQTFKRWELFRGTSPDPTTTIASGQDVTTSFYRDTSLAQDTNYYYRLEIVRCVAPCSLPENDRRYIIFSDNASTGVFQGIVTRDLTLSGGIYEIGFGGVGDSAVVEVAPGASLAINGGAVVKADPGLSNVGLRAKGGSLYLDQVSFQDTAIAFGDYYEPSTAGGGWVRGSTIQNGSIQLYSSNHVLIDQNQGEIFITADHQADVAITHNTFEGSIEIVRQASAVISYNALTNADIEVSGYGALAEPKASALVSNNTITNQYQSQGVEVADGASLTLTDNTIQWTGFHGSEASILVGAYNQGTSLVARRNSLSGGKIFASWGPYVDISDNVLLGGGSAITIGCVLCGTDTQATGSIQRNTVQSGWGLEMWPGSQGLLIQHNCIRDNDPGLTLDDAYMTSPLDVRYNYWGAASGPSHPTNDGGTGDRIEGSQVLFDPWDTTDMYCRVEPIDPSEADLQVKQVSLIQVVEGVSTLVEAKPLAVKAVVSSSAAVPLPVEVHLNYGGIDRDTFYEFSIEKLDPASLQLHQPATQVTFLEAGTKTVYFFPAEAPFGDTATAQVTIDPNNQIKELNETNNTNTANQPVVKTYWGDNPQDQTLQILSVPIDPAISKILNPIAITHHQNADNLLPLAPIDYGWQIKSTPPERYTQLCPETVDMSLDEIAKTEYRGLKLEHPNTHRFMMIIRDGWFNYDKYTCLKPIPLTNGYLFTASSSIPQLVFIARTAWQRTPDMIAGIVHSYGLPIKDALIKIQSALMVDTRTILDNSAAQTLGIGPIYSLMGIRPYKGLRYIDNESYQTLLDKVDTPAVQGVANAVDGLVLVSGKVGIDDQVQFDPLFYLPSGAADSPPTGNYAVSFLDGSDTVLYDQDFSISFDSLTITPITQTAFAFALPYLPGTEKVIVTKDGSPIGSLQASANAPQVQVIAPNGGESLSGEHTVTWSGTDLDGDSLTYAVLYSPDGGTDWQTLAVDLTTTSLTWNTDDYPGAQGSGRIKVLVSDGFLTGEDISDGGFSVDNKPPTAGITVPFSGAAVTSGDALHLDGLALDPEDGWLESASLRWSSNHDGPLGTGSSVDTILTYGEHVITLTARDSQSLTNTDQITVTVISESDPDLSLSADLFDNQQQRAVCQVGGLSVTLQNIIADTYARIEFFDGDPEAGGRLIGRRRLYAEANSLNETGLEWTPGSSGVHAIYIRVTAINANETNTTNNQVILDLQVGEGTCPVYLPLQERR